MRDIDLTIAFITYNRPTELLRAVKSCLPINNVNYEIIIWDNHSNEKNHSLVEKEIEIIPYARYIYSEENLGVAGGRNAVWNESRGKYVFFLDDDAVLSEPFLEALFQYMNANNKVGGLALNIEEPATANYLNTPYYYFSGNHKYVLTFVGGAHMIKKEAVCTETLYPNKLSFGSEELYACLGLWQRNYYVEELTDYTVYHMPSRINRCDGLERDTNFIVNQYVIKRLLYPVIFFPIIYCMYRLRLTKHKIEYMHAKKLFCDRYRKEESYRMSVGRVFWMIHKFGIKIII